MFFSDWKKKIIASAASILLLLGGIYLGLSLYYINSFGLGTWINGIYCTGKGISEVKQLLDANYDYTELTIKTEDGEIRIDVSDCSLEYDYGEAIDLFLKKQNSFCWPQNLFKGKSQTVTPVIRFDQKKLDEILNEYEIFTYSVKPKVEMSLTEEGYMLSDTCKHIPDCELMRTAIRDAIYAADEEIVIDDGYYYDAQYSKEQLETIDTYNRLKSQLNFSISYKMGNDKELIDEYILASFLQRDNQNNLILSENNTYYEWDWDKIEEWVDKLASKYDSVGKKRKFNTTAGKVIEIEGGTYGNKLDIDAEKEFLKAAVLDGKNIEHEPGYIQKAFCQGLEDIGNTYIEVDMTEQKLYYYLNGECLIDTPIVTGNMMLGRDTPEGVNYVYYMQRNRTLHGPNYATFVKYWIAVVGHIGIHDASWRNKYGGDIYLTDGSHGCINTPEEEVSRLYDMVELGTPAIMFY